MKSRRSGNVRIVGRDGLNHVRFYGAGSVFQVVLPLRLIVETKNKFRSKTNRLETTWGEDLCSLYHHVLFQDSTRVASSFEKYHASIVTQVWFHCVEAFDDKRNVPSMATRHRQTDKINETFTRSQQPLLATSFAVTNTYMWARVKTSYGAYIQRCTKKDRREESRALNIHDSIGISGMDGSTGYRIPIEIKEKNIARILEISSFVVDRRDLSISRAELKKKSDGVSRGYGSLEKKKEKRKRSELHSV